MRGYFRERVVCLEFWQYFFIYGSELPENVGFSLFGLWHFLWLGILSAAAVCYVLRYAKKKESVQRGWDIAIGSSLVGWIVLRTVYLIAIGYMSVYELPLHLCSIAGILCLIHSFIKWDWTGQVLYSICLPGTILALIFPDWTNYPAIHFITIEGFCFHIGIVMYVGSQLVSHKILPQLKKLWKVVVFLAVLIPLIYVFDKHYSANYLFVLRPSAGSPLEWLADIMGIPGYLWGYGGLILLCVVLMDLGYEKVAGKRKRNA